MEKNMYWFAVTFPTKVEVELKKEKKPLFSDTCAADAVDGDSD